MHHSFNLTEKISFPKPSMAGFPLGELLDRYLSNLIPVSPIHSELVELLFRRIGLDSARAMICRYSVNRFSTKQVEDFEQAADVDDLIRSMRKIMIDVSKNKGHDRALRKYFKAAHRSRRGVEYHRPFEYMQKLKRLGTGLGLSFQELQILEVAVCYQLSSEFMCYCDQYISSDWPYLISQALDLSPDIVQKCISGDQGLLQKGVLTFNLTNMDVQETLFHYLIGFRSDFIDPGFCTRLNPSPYPLESFPVPSEELDLIQRTLASPGGGHILFYGRPGTGKTELANVLAHTGGFEPLLLACGKDGSQQERRMAVTTALSMSSDQTLFILDEADTLLNSCRGFFQPEVDKSWINHFLDTCPQKVIWITNDVDDIPASILRRFAYSLCFKKFTHEQRCSTWNIQLQEKHMRPWLSEKAVVRLSRNYQTDAGAIASAVEVTRKLYKGHSPGTVEAEATLGTLLSHHVRLSGIRESAQKPRKVPPVYDLEALHTDVSPIQVLRALKAYSHREVEEDFPASAALLLWGLPGTGKTQFATYLAEELGRPLIQKRMSDLQSKYVGETEQQISAAFKEAEKQQGILLLDEADSLFLDRTTAHRSWESSQTNEVLTQMEEFKGICICCTNLLEHLDRAALRRFTWKIEFKPLHFEGRKRLYRRYFQPRGRLSQEVLSRLTMMPHLTPGDFKVVCQQIRLAGAGANASEILDALDREQAYKTGVNGLPIGFNIGGGA
jgi:transitional endoplasmic reticulum ATPase